MNINLVNKSGETAKSKPIILVKITVETLCLTKDWTPMHKS